MKLIKILPFVFLFTDACVERLDVPTQSSASSLIVDGLITDQPGPYIVKLYHSNDVLGNVGPFVASKGSVTIVDEAGIEEKLSETTRGTYQTNLNGIRGVAGHTYHVEIFIDGKEYRSIPQTLASAGTMGGLYYTFQENMLNTDNLESSIVPHDVLNIYTDAQGSEGASNLFRWRWSSIYEIQAFPELRVTWGGTPPKPSPDPVPCSGYIASNGGIKQIGSCTCCTCWANEAGHSVIISNNQLVNNTEFKEVNVATLPVDKWRFNIKYYIKVEQLSLSEEAFAFWKLLKAQEDGERNLFQPNAIKIKGNLFSVTTPQEEVLGIFGVSAVVSKELFIFPKDIPKALQIDTARESCAKTIFHPTLIKPSFW
jgi:hypothetical protein